MEQLVEVQVEEDNEARHSVGDPGLSLGYLELKVFGGVVGRRETTLVTSPGKRRVPFAIAERRATFILVLARLSNSWQDASEETH